LIAWLENLHEGVIVAAKTMLVVTSASSFVTIMQQQGPVVTQGANVVAVEDAKLMAATK
jgi:hypothetical protein